MTQFEEYFPQHERRELEREKRQRKLFKIRNILNLLFMLLAIVGIVWTLVGDREIGWMIIICAIPLKMTSSVLRLLK